MTLHVRTWLDYVRRVIIFIMKRHTFDLIIKLDADDEDIDLGDPPD